MTPVRIFFRKFGAARYISHLDLQRLFARALRRAGLPVWYSEGFNPHIYLTFSLPLSLGVESDCEYLDLRLTDDAYPLGEAKERLAASIPKGIEITAVAPPRHNPKGIAAARYDIGFADVSAEELRAILSADRLEVLKKTKKTEATIDLKPFLGDLRIAGAGEGAALSATLPAGNNFSLNPQLLVDLCAAALGREPQVRIARRAVFLESGEAFS